MPIEGTQRVVGRLLIPEHDNPGRLLRLVALGLSVEAAGQVPIAAGDQRQPRPDAVEEDSHNLECPSVDLVHELTGKSEDQHGRPVEKDDSDKGIQGAVSSLPSSTSSMDSSNSAPPVPEWDQIDMKDWKSGRDLFLIKIATSQQ